MIVTNQDSCIYKECTMTPDQRTIAFGKVCLVVVLIFILGILSESTDAEDNNRYVKKVANDALLSKREEVKNHFLNNELKVKDAIWYTNHHFAVAVFDDGTRRDGYAMYVCSVLYDHGFKGQSISVEVLDIIKIVKDKKQVVLGKHYCDSFL